jgi:hypothetical protein
MARHTPCGDKNPDPLPAAFLLTTVGIWRFLARDFNSNMWMIDNFYAGGRETDDPE